MLFDARIFPNATDYFISRNFSNSSLLFYFETNAPKSSYSDNALFRGVGLYSLKTPASARNNYLYFGFFNRLDFSILGLGSMPAITL